MAIRRASLRRLRLPLARPYRLSYRTFEEFEPYFIELEDDGGRAGFADGHVSPGSSSETREGAWDFCRDALGALIGREPEDALHGLAARFEESKVAATAVACAVESLSGHPALEIDTETVLPLLAPVNGLTPEAIEAEIEAQITAGFRTFKVKVGKDLEADAARLAVIQRAVAGRAALRLDANRAYTREQALDFVGRISPEAIALFEQPCAAEDWDANAAVAAASPVPLMLDEPICALEDVDRAARIENVRFCKLKLKRFGGMSRLIEGLDRVRERGMGAVLGDGLGSEIHNWMEAAAARGRIEGAGEFNGFLKPRERLFAPPMPFEAGAIRLPAGWRPSLDREALDQFTEERLDFGSGW